MGMIAANSEGLIVKYWNLIIPAIKPKYRIHPLIIRIINIILHPAISLADPNNLVYTKTKYKKDPLWPKYTYHPHMKIKKIIAKPSIKH